MSCWVLDLAADPSHRRRPAALSRVCGVTARRPLRRYWVTSPRLNLNRSPAYSANVPGPFHRRQLARALAGRRRRSCVPPWRASWSGRPPNPAPARYLAYFNQIVGVGERLAALVARSTGGRTCRPGTWLDANARRKSVSVEVYLRSSLRGHAATALPTLPVVGPPRKWQRPRARRLRDRASMRSTCTAFSRRLETRESEGTSSFARSSAACLPERRATRDVPAQNGPPPGSYEGPASRGFAIICASAAPMLPSGIRF